MNLVAKRSRPISGTQEAMISAHPAKAAKTPSDDSSGSNGFAEANLLDVPNALIKDLVKVFKLLSDETRMHILLYLTRAAELHVRALCDLLGQSQPAVSHHLALLKNADVIELRREGKHNFYRLVPQRFEQVLELLFDGAPANERRLRFENYVLSYEPVAK